MSGIVVGGGMMAMSAVSAACFACSCAANMCCSLASCFGCSDRSPALAKLVYLFIFLSSAVLAVVLRFYGKPAFQTTWYIPTMQVCDNSIESCFGVQAVYRALGGGALSAGQSSPPPRARATHPHLDPRTLPSPLPPPPLPSAHQACPLPWPASLPSWRSSLPRRP